TPQVAASAAAAVAFHTLYSPASANSKLPQGLSSRRTDQLVRVGSVRKLAICHPAFEFEPYRSTLQKARAMQRSTLSPVSKAIKLPRRGIRFTSLLKEVSTASRSL